MPNSAMPTTRAPHYEPLQALPLHHIGVACKSIERELPLFELLGFVYEAEFIDEAQGVKGVFLTSNANTAKNARVELLENLPQSTRLDTYLKHHNKLYHLAFESQNIQADCASILESTPHARKKNQHYGENQAEILLSSDFNGGGGIVKSEQGQSMREIRASATAGAAEKMPTRAKPRLIVPIMESSYFARLCFIMLPNRLLIELVELKK